MRHLPIVQMHIRLMLSFALFTLMACGDSSAVDGTTDASPLGDADTADAGDVGIDAPVADVGTDSDATTDVLPEVVEVTPDVSTDTSPDSQNDAGMDTSDTSPDAADSADSTDVVEPELIRFEGPCSLQIHEPSSAEKGTAPIDKGGGAPRTDSYTYNEYGQKIGMTRFYVDAGAFYETWGYHRDLVASNSFHHGDETEAVDIMTVWTTVAGLDLVERRVTYVGTGEDAWLSNVQFHTFTDTTHEDGTRTVTDTTCFVPGPTEFDLDLRCDAEGAYDNEMMVYEFDAEGRRSRRWHDIRPVNGIPDTINTFVYLEDEPGYDVEVDRDADGLVDHIDHVREVNGELTRFGYTEITSSEDPEARTVAYSWEYVHREDGQIDRREDYRSDGTISRTYDYRYDEAGNLLEVWILDPGEDDFLHTEYDYEGCWDDLYPLSERYWEE